MLSSFGACLCSFLRVARIGISVSMFCCLRFEFDLSLEIDWGFGGAVCVVVVG